MKRSRRNASDKHNKRSRTDESKIAEVLSGPSSFGLKLLPDHQMTLSLRQAQILQTQSLQGNSFIQEQLSHMPFSTTSHRSNLFSIQRVLSEAEKLEELSSSRFAGEPVLETAYGNDPALRKGDTGDGVAKIQQALIDLGFAMPISTKKTGNPDGIYGSETKEVVTQFQAKFNLSQDGKVGRETMGKLDALFAKDGPKPKTIVVNDKVLQDILDDIQTLPGVDPGIAINLKFVSDACAANPAANLQFLGKLEKMRLLAVEKGASEKLLEAIDMCIRPLTAHIGIMTSKGELKSAASELTDSERETVAKAMKPRPATPGGVQPDFHSVLPDGRSYRDRLKEYLEARIERLYRELVVDKGPADRTSENLHSWDRLAEIANAAKTEVDIVFGNYKKAPPLKPNVNLFDMWEDEEATIRRLSPGNKTGKAKNFVKYFLKSGGDKLRQINADHGADIGRKTVSPGETKSEFDILKELRAEIVSSYETQLLEIERGWEGAQGGGDIYLQRWKQDSDVETRHFFWDTFQTMIHEYLHLIKHPKYDSYARKFGEESPQEHTLIEGMDSVLTETVWVNVEPRVKSPAIRRKVEGPELATQEWNDDVVPSITDQRYPSYEEAMNVASHVGMHNVLAAYFLGVMKGWPKPEGH